MKGRDAMNQTTPAPMTVEDLAARMLAEIREDVASGRVPKWVGTFANLHDFVDANEYGGLCEDGNARVINAAQDCVDAAIRAGVLYMDSGANVKVSFDFNIPSDDSIWTEAAEGKWSQETIAWEYLKRKGPKVAAMAMGVALEPRGVRMAGYRRF